MQIVSAFEGRVFWGWKRLDNLPENRLERRQVTSDVARGALCDLAVKVTGESGLTYHRDDEGKPAIRRTENSGFYGASISHSRDIFAVAFCLAGAVGIDIEYRDLARKIARLEKWLFGDRRENSNSHDAQRMAQLAKDPRQNDFYQQWCVYEAIFKCTGINDPALKLPSDTVYLDEWPDYAGALVWQGT
ncbi:4'-phosphopantetheinyl transferase superfamily protein [Thalassospira sp. TSL5-1]|uniref:4'-phosphopantetheinyl transferase family protein n=1 Tax=Thalassospira sp. TSL5-1 TaxID=1544451 RepID=UPI000939DE78|nr:4'-phosphopantetheinyl transferase superfamily protein [Thalassospira sp. TSL5-1]OKH88386.1 hypothetical protein LF95_17395 [Thalassospira sp. TSL5-1]